MAFYILKHRPAPYTLTVWDIGGLKILTIETFNCFPCLCLVLLVQSINLDAYQLAAPRSCALTTRNEKF